MFHTIKRAASVATAHRAALVAPASFRESDNSVEVTWTTGAPVHRQGFFGGEWIETLEVSARAVRMDRMNAGAALLDSHDQYRVSAILGSVIPGSARIANGIGTCRVRFADSTDAIDALDKVRAGHLSKISVGYLVHTYERHPSDNDEPDEIRAIDWEPVEISLVSVPADPAPPSVLGVPN